MKLAVALAVLPAAAAFVGPAAPAAEVRMQESKSDLEALAKGLNPTIGFWDPLNVAGASGSLYGFNNEQTIAWYRQAEIKHGRVAMAAFVGMVLQANGWVFPGNIAPGVTFKSCVGATPLDTWDNVPLYGKYQIIAWVGLMELCTEIQKPHYLMGGKVGEVNFDPVAKTYSLWDPIGSMKKWDDATKARGRLVELQNGRAAMFGVAGLVSAWKTDGSVPLLNFFPDYTGGLPTEPFAANWHLSGI